MTLSLTDKIAACATMAELDELQEGAIYAIRHGVRLSLTDEEKRAFTWKRAELGKGK